jgi:hypothetical protein
MYKWLLIAMSLASHPALAVRPQAPAPHGAPGRPVPAVLWDDVGGRQASSTWIGVKMAPVPDALAAHLGRGGLMVANVVKDSPADAAGLERYDVLVSLDGRAIESMKDLVEAISAVGTDRSAPLVLIRVGQQQTVNITPVARPDAPPTEFKYDEPLAADDVTRYFGHRLRRDPHGNWLFEPLGQLKDFPDPLRDMLEKSDPAWRDWMEKWKKFSPDPLRLRLRPDPNDPDRNLFFVPDDAAEDKDAHVSITVSEDDETVTIERHPDGRIDVRRTDRDGQESSASYGGAEELREKDAEAYRLYRRYTGYKQRRWFTVPPRWPDLQRRQEEWRKQLEDSLQKLREQSDQQREQARQMVEEALRLGEEARERFRLGGPGSVTWHKGLSVKVAPDGRVRVVITSDGQTETHSFDSVEELRQQNPELYEKIRGWLGDLDGDERGQAPPLPSAPIA